MPSELLVLLAKYDQRAEKIEAKVTKMHQAIADYLAAEMAQLGNWFQNEYSRHIPKVSPQQIPLVSLWADVAGNKYVVYQGERLYWEGSPSSHIGWLRPMINALMETEEALSKQLAEIHGTDALG